jgi:alpha-beta hydrolase superfamily lysophospholipase
MQYEEVAFKGQDGTGILVRSWRPEGPVRGTLVIAHGLGEHAGRYGELVTHCLARGLAVYAPDHRGHGRSGGRRALVRRFAWLVDDLDVVMRRAAAGHPEVKRFLFGHSMGGAIALTWALDHPGQVDGLILSAPAIAPPRSVSTMTVLVVRLLSRILPGKGAIALPPEDLSRDPEVVRAYADDPAVLHGPVPARTLAELLGAMKSLPGRAAALREPVLVLQGTGDRLVMHADVKPVFDALGSPDKTVKVYRGLYHEVLNEPEREQVFADLGAWLDAQL